MVRFSGVGVPPEGDNEMSSRRPGYLCAPLAQGGSRYGDATSTKPF